MTPFSVIITFRLAYQEIQGQFMEKNGNPVKELKCPEWVQDLAFMVDITQHLNNLNKMLQGCKKRRDSVRQHTRVQIKTVTLGDAAI